MNVPSQITPHILLGSAAVRTPHFFKTNGITLVINAAKEYRDSKKCCVRQILLGSVDNPDYNLKNHFEEVGDHIHKEIGKGGKVYVHCLAGISRAPSLVLAYLVRHKKMALEDAYKLVKGKRTFIRPNPGFWRQLIEYEKEVRGSNSVTLMHFGEKLIPSVYQTEYDNMLTI